MNNIPSINAFLIVFLTIFCQAQGTSNAGHPRKGLRLIKIATQSPLSGPMSIIGNDIKNGSWLAIQQLSKPLAEMGFKVVIASFDDQGNPDVGVANAKKIISDPAMLGVVGHFNSGIQIACSGWYHAANLCNVSPSNTNPEVTEKGYLEINRVCGRDDVQGAAVAQFAKSKGIETAYVLHDKTYYGHLIAESFKKEAEAQGMEVVGFVGTDEHANFDAILPPILNAKPQCIYFGGMYDQAALFFKQMRQNFFNGMCLSGDGFDSADAAKIAGGALVQGGGTFFSTVGGPASFYPNTTKFVNDFRINFGKDPQPNAAQSYDCAAVLLKAIENVVRTNGNKFPTRSEVSKAVRALQNFKGVTGTYTFNEKGDPSVCTYFIIQVTSPDPDNWAFNKLDQTISVSYSDLYVPKAGGVQDNRGQMPQPSSTTSSLEQSENSKDGSDHSELFNELLSKSQKGDIESQFKLGNAYYHGRGCQVDVDSAEKWWKVASENGLTLATYNLLAIYSDQGLKHNSILYYKTLIKASEQGDGDKQFELGCNYVEGDEGLIKNIPFAYMWISLACEQKVKNSRKTLADLVSIMSLKELREGKALFEKKRIQLMRKDLQKQIKTLTPGSIGIITDGGLKPLQK